MLLTKKQYIELQKKNLYTIYSYKNDSILKTPNDNDSILITYDRDNLFRSKVIYNNITYRVHIEDCCVVSLDELPKKYQKQIDKLILEIAKKLKVRFKTNIFDIIKKYCYNCTYFRSEKDDDYRWFYVSCIKDEFNIIRITTKKN